jgi:transposase
MNQRYRDNGQIDDGVAALPVGVGELRTLILEQQRQLKQQSLFIDQPLEQVRLARHQHFDTRSERFSVDQLALAFNEAEAATVLSDDPEVEKPDILSTVTVPAHRRAKEGRRPLPKTFPRVDVVQDVDEGDCQCGECRTELFAVSENVTEQLDIKPARLRVLRHVRKTYACRGGDSNVVTAPMPTQPIPRSLASPRILAHVAVAKYVDGLPLYRQEKKLARIGVELPRSTLAHWMIRAGELVQPPINLLRDRLLAYDIVCIDETRLQVLKEPGKRAESQSYI